MPVKKTTKKYKLSTEREKALSEFQKYCRLSEVDDYGYGTCWTCGKIIHFNEGDGGHGIPRNHRGTELERSNCHLQCRVCNRFDYGAQYKFMSHVALEYGVDEVERLIAMDDAYGGSDDARLRLSQEDLAAVTKKKDALYYHEQYLYWRQKTQEEERRLEGGLV